MTIKTRIMCMDLIVRDYLNTRGGLNEKETRQFLYDEKGYQGELNFDKLINTLPEQKYISIQDLLIKLNNSYLQVDNLISTQDKLTIFEVKNHEGDHYCENEKWYTPTNYEIKNPLH